MSATKKEKPVALKDKTLPARGSDKSSRTGMSREKLTQSFRDNLYYFQGRHPATATVNDYYLAAAYTVRERLVERWLRSIEATYRTDAKVVCYLSAEFLTGPHLGNNLINLGIYDQAALGIKKTGLELETLLEHEPEPGLGNGGLGRLAACYIDSLATLEVPAIGYGIRYEFGIFNQGIQDGWQVEYTDKWLQLGNPWEIGRPELSVEVRMGGRTEGYVDEKGHFRVRWIADRAVRGIPYDTPILGYKVNTCNMLRLWKAEACESFDFQSFNVGDYYGAVDEKVASENLTKVLYPNDEPAQGKQLRLEQQYFFVSCSLQDMIRMHLMMGRDITTFPEQFAVQLNDTHPAVAVVELMRLLVDEQGLDWEQAWRITTKTLAYTNHTLLAEALERWPVELFGRLLPRHLDIIYEVNRRFLEEVQARYPGDGERMARMSIIDESGGRYVRMAHLATVGSHAVNGVAALHTELLKEHVLHDFYGMWPERFSNKTNGVTPRRWIALANPGLTRLVTSSIGETWLKDLDELRKLEMFIEDGQFRKQWRQVKLDAKKKLAAIIKERTGITVTPSTLFDVQVKRLHEYKRQHLMALYIITLYHRIQDNPDTELLPRTFLFGGKAAPGYFMAKLIIKLINSVAEVVNNDPEVRGLLKVVFLPNFSVKMGQRVYPAADLSEQISLAGKEASGTGNMKFSMNGALTIGTLDGANVEIREEVGPENFFLFGLTTPQVYDRKARGYNPREFYDSNAGLRRVLDSIGEGRFSGGDGALFRPLLDSLLSHDDYMLLADYQSYVDCQERVSEAYQDTERWTRMSILNVARMGKFSSDRAIREYCSDIWKAVPVSVDLD